MVFIFKICVVVSCRDVVVRDRMHVVVIVVRQAGCRRGNTECQRRRLALSIHRVPLLSFFLPLPLNLDVSFVLNEQIVTPHQLRDLINNLCVRHCEERLPFPGKTLK